MDKLYFKRYIINKIFISLISFAMVIGLFFLGYIVLTIIIKGFAGLDLSVFTHATKPPQTESGLGNAIIGSLSMISIAILIGSPIGILAGIYLAEYGRKNKLAETIRFVNDLLLSIPSIIVGLFIYEIYVIQTRHYSGWAGAFALSIIVMPIVVRTTEDILMLIPNVLRESAAALGAPRWKIILSIAMRIAKAGIFTGVILALARISGETAPLLFTALNNSFWNTSLNQPMANLPVTIFQYAMSPYKDWQQLAWTGAMLISLWVLIISIIARLTLALKKRPLT